MSTEIALEGWSAYRTLQEWQEKLACSRVTLWRKRCEDPDETRTHGRKVSITREIAHSWGLMLPEFGTGETPETNETDSVSGQTLESLESKVAALQQRLSQVTEQLEELSHSGPPARETDETLSVSSSETNETLSTAANVPVPENTAQQARTRETLFVSSGETNETKPETSMEFNEYVCRHSVENGYPCIPILRDPIVSVKYLATVWAAQGTKTAHFGNRAEEQGLVVAKINQQRCVRLSDLSKVIYDEEGTA